MLILKGHRSRVRGLTFTSNGLLASIGGRGTSVSLWDLDHNGKRRYLSHHDLIVDHLAASPQGLLVSVDRWSNWALWKGLSQRPVQTGRVWATVFGLAFSSAGKNLYMGEHSHSGFGYSVKRWQINQRMKNLGPFLKQGKGGKRGYGLAVVAGGKGTTLAIPLSNGQVHLWDLPSRTLRATCNPGRAIRSLALSPEEELLAVASGREITLWEVATGTLRARVRGHQRVVTGLAFSPDGRSLVSSSTDGLVKHWDRTLAVEQAAFDWNLGPLHGLALSPDGMRGACGSQDGGIVVWDIDV
jgi:WD40 repeat protein